MGSTTRRSDWTAHLPQGAHVDELRADATLPGRWTRRWRARAPWPQVRTPDGRWLFSDELEARTRHLAERLLGTGLEPGQRIVLSGESSLALVEAYVGALRAGLVVVPLNPAYTETEV